MDSPDDEGRGPTDGVPRESESFPSAERDADARAFDRAEAEDLRDEKDTVVASETLRRSEPMPPATVAAAAAARRTASRGEPEPAVPEVNEGDGLRGRAPGRAGGSPEDRAFCAASPRNGERVDAAATASAAARSCGGMVGGGRGEGGDRAGWGDARRREAVAASDDPSRGTALPEAGTERARGVRGRATHPLVVALVRFAGARARRRFRRGGVFLVLFVDGGGVGGCQRSGAVASPR